MCNYKICIIYKSYNMWHLYNVYDILRITYGIYMHIYIYFHIFTYISVQSAINLLIHSSIHSYTLLVITDLFYKSYIMVKPGIPAAVTRIAGAFCCKQTWNNSTLAQKWSRIEEETLLWLETPRKLSPCTTSRKPNRLHNNFNQELHCWMLSTPYNILIIFSNNA